MAYPNTVISMPSQLFTTARSFKACSNGNIYIGEVDTDPTIPSNQVQVYLENEDGSTVPVAQPIKINSAGYPVYNGQIAKFIANQAHSMAVYNAYNAQEFYFPDVYKFNPIAPSLEYIDLTTVARANNVNIDQVAYLQTGTVSGILYFYDVATETVYAANPAVSGDITAIGSDVDGVVAITVDGFGVDISFSDITEVSHVGFLVGSKNRAGQSVRVISYHDGWAAQLSVKGGGLFHWSQLASKTDHDGGNVINPNATFPTDWSDQSQLSDWFTFSEMGTGCWIRAEVDDKKAQNFGAKGDGVSIDTLPFKQIVIPYSNNETRASFGNGEFVIDDELFLADGSVDSYFKGAGLGSVLLSSLPDNSSFLINSDYPDVGFSSGIARLKMSDFTARSQNELGGFVNGAGFVYSDFTDIRYLYFNTGFTLDRAWSLNFTRVSEWYNTTAFTFVGTDVNKIHFESCRFYYSRKVFQSGCRSLTISNPTIEGNDVVFAFDSDSGPSGPITIDGGYIERNAVILDIMRDYNLSFTMKNAYILNSADMNSGDFIETLNTFCRFKGGNFTHQASIILDNLDFAGHSYDDEFFYSEPGVTLSPGLRISVTRLRTQVLDFTTNKSILPESFYEFFVGDYPRFSQCYSDIPLIYFDGYLDPLTVEIEKSGLRYSDTPSPIDGTRYNNGCYIEGFGLMNVNSSTFVTGIPSRLLPEYRSFGGIFSNSVTPDKDGLLHIVSNTNGDFWVRSTSGSNEYYGTDIDMINLRYKISGGQ